MKSFLISKNDAEQRLDKFILKKFPKLPKSLMFKEIRKKNIKINKKRTQPDYILAEGDLLELYLKDDALQEKEVHYDFMSASKELDIVFEDKKGKFYKNNNNSIYKEDCYEKDSVIFNVINWICFIWMLSKQPTG